MTKKTFEAALELEAQEQVLNEIARHCKIGRVKLKSIPRPDPVIPMWPAPQRDWWNDPYMPIWNPMFGSANRKCSCPPGSACGNVACPHMPIITSGHIGWPHPASATMGGQLG